MRQPFARFAADHFITVLHQLGKATVARIRPRAGGPAFYAARLRTHMGTGQTVAEACQAVRDKLAHELELLDWDAAVAAGCTHTELDRFVLLNALDPTRAYTRQELRQLLLPRGADNMQLFGAALTRIGLRLPRSSQ